MHHKQSRMHSPPGQETATFTLKFPISWVPIRRIAQRICEFLHDASGFLSLIPTAGGCVSSDDLFAIDIFLAFTIPMSTKLVKEDET
ncbi:hypothetical protein JTB14_031656 [Gonioctena quinquepunctata]|nr:hypothetical protein JTB14_031656 [Gonioctena quinquepunctata]